MSSSAASASASASSSAAAAAASSSSSSAAAMQQFVLIAKGHKGKALEALISQAIAHRGLFRFGELLAEPSVRGLRGTEFDSALNTLELFAYGVYADYEAAQSEHYLQLTETQVRKLRMLSIVAIASSGSGGSSKVLPYAQLMDQLGMQQEGREQLEDLIISTMYAGLIKGKLDQQEGGRLVVRDWIARDIRVETEVPEMIDILTRWRDACVDTQAQLLQAQSDAAERRTAEDNEQATLVAMATDLHQQLSERARAKGLGMSSANIYGDNDFDDEDDDDFYPGVEDFDGDGSGNVMDFASSMMRRRGMGGVGGGKRSRTGGARGVMGRMRMGR